MNCELAGVVGPAAYELGRTLAPLDTLDVLLGGALWVTGLSRYAREGATLAELSGAGIVLSRADELEPVAYVDAIGAALVVRASGTGEADEPSTRRAAWTSANVGYLAGALGYGLELTLAHAKATCRASSGAFFELTVSEAVAGLTARGVPAAPVRRLEQLFSDEQANANGLVQTVEQESGPVALLGNVFKVDGAAQPAARGAPGLDEHRGELRLSES